MKLSLILAAVVIAATSLTACMDPKPAQYPPSMSMERDSAPDREDMRNESDKGQN